MSRPSPFHSSALFGLALSVLTALPASVLAQGGVAAVMPQIQNNNPSAQTIYPVNSFSADGYSAPQSKDVALQPNAQTQPGSSPQHRVLLQWDAASQASAAMQPNVAPQMNLPPQMSSAAGYPQPENMSGAVFAPVEPTQLVSFQQESVITPPATQQLPSGDMYRRLIQQDTAGPDVNAIMNQPTYGPPPSGTTPNCGCNYCCDSNAWHSQVLPQGIIYQSYLAGTKEPRFATWFDQNSKMGDMWDVSLGARAGLWRYGNDDPNWPEGWQLDIEGGVFPRLDPQGVSTPLIGDDYRFGIPLTYGGDRWEFKMGYYHISAHLGDEYVLFVNPAANRINYVRDSAILGAGYFYTPAVRMYGEVGVGAVDGGAKPVEFQFGCEWVQARNTGLRGGPFAAINADLRQEVDYGGNVTVQFGWMWRQFARGPNWRIGAQYFYGKEDEYEFFQQTVSRFGWGLWYDF